MEVLYGELDKVLATKITSNAQDAAIARHRHLADISCKIRKLLKKGREAAHPERYLFKLDVEVESSSSEYIIKETGSRIESLLNICFGEGIKEEENNDTNLSLSCKYFILSLFLDFMKEIRSNSDTLLGKKRSLLPWPHEGDNHEGSSDIFIDKFILYLDGKNCRYADNMCASVSTSFLNYKPIFIKLLDILRLLIDNFNASRRFEHIVQIINSLIASIPIQDTVGLANLSRRKQCRLVERNSKNGITESLTCWTLLLRLHERLFTRLKALGMDEGSFKSFILEITSLETNIIKVSENVISTLHSMGGIALAFSFLSQEDDKELVELCLQLTTSYSHLHYAVEDRTRHPPGPPGGLSVAFASSCQNIMAKFVAESLDVECVLVHFLIVGTFFDSNLCLDLIDSRETETMQYLIHALKILAYGKRFNRDTLFRACGIVFDKYTSLKENGDQHHLRKCDSIKREDKSPSNNSSVIILSACDVDIDIDGPADFSIVSKEWQHKPKRPTGECIAQLLPSTAEALFNASIQFFKSLLKLCYGKTQYSFLSNLLKIICMKLDT